MDRNYCLIVFIVYMSYSGTKKVAKCCVHEKKLMLKKKGGGGAIRVTIGYPVSTCDPNYPYLENHYRFSVLYISVRKLKIKYSQTCIKRSPLGQRKIGLLRQVTS
jgi:hypothetical protein